MINGRSIVVAALLVGVGATVASGEDELAAQLVEAGRVKIRAQVDSEQVYVGQKIELAIDVLTATWFPRAPRFPENVEIDAAVVLPPESFGINFNERIAGTSYAGQTRKLTIFATRPGAFEVPPLEVTVIVADENAKPTPPFALRTEPLTFVAQLPAGVRGSALVPATPRLTAAQQWAPEATELRVGDAITRTVELAIDESVSMLLPEVTFTAPAGIRVYPDRPEAADDRQRGRVRGKRTQSATYVVEREGSFELPAIEIRWWDLEAEQLRTNKLDGIELEVRVNDELAARHQGGDVSEEPAAAPPPPEGDWTGWVVGFVVLLVVLAAARPVRAVLRRLIGERGASNASARQRFEKFESAAAAGDAPKTLAALYAWLDHTRPQATTLESFAAEAGDAQLARQLDELLAAACGDGVSWSAGDLVRRVRYAARAALDRSRPSTHLAPLNP